MGTGALPGFFKGGGGHTGSNNIVMAFSLRNIGLQRGVTGTPGTPLATPLGERGISRTTTLNSDLLDCIYRILHGFPPGKNSALEHCCKMITTVFKTSLYVTQSPK